MYKHFFKRVIDLILSFIGLIILSPVIILVSVLLLFSNNGKIFFLQTRPGLKEHLFKIIKFKTMNDKRDKNGNLLSDAERLTTVGKLIRKSSFDEILQLINVLKGDMSLIGPRPLLPDYLPLYNQEQKLRHSIRPGITGWAQVNGRNTIGWKEKFEYDTWYVKNISFELDTKIILMTLKKIVKPEGINQPGHPTAERFTGNNR